MQELKKSKSGFYTLSINNTKINLYLQKEHLPNDDSLETLKQIASMFNIYGDIIALPDLHFKVKNFVPSGMTISLKNSFTPLLLGPNNDGIGLLKFSPPNDLTKDDINKIFSNIKKEVFMFRRKDDIISNEELENIFSNGIVKLIERYGFSKSDLQKFENGGIVKQFSNVDEIMDAFSDSDPNNLPVFVPSSDVFEQGKKCIGVLDGTSHFIELFNVEKIINSDYAKYLEINENDYFFAVHAGAGDVGIISHRTYLNSNNQIFNFKTEIGRKAYDSFAAAGNYGFANRLYIFFILKKIIKNVIGVNVEIISDAPHDFLEHHPKDDYYIHRKGSVKALPGKFYNENVIFRKTGFPFVFPSCAGGSAYIVSNFGGNEDTFYTTSHGAGRMIRKDEAIGMFRDEDVEMSFEHNIQLFRYGVDEIEGQHPKSFKDMKSVMDILQRFNLVYPIIKLKPVASLKG